MAVFVCLGGSGAREITLSDPSVTRRVSRAFTRQDNPTNSYGMSNRCRGNKPCCIFSNIGECCLLSLCGRQTLEC